MRKRFGVVLIYSCAHYSDVNVLQMFIKKKEEKKKKHEWRPELFAPEGALNAANYFSSVYAHPCAGLWARQGRTESSSTIAPHILLGSTLPTASGPRSAGEVFLTSVSNSFGCARRLQVHEEMHLGKKEKRKNLMAHILAIARLNGHCYDWKSRIHPETQKVFI